MQGTDCFDALAATRFMSSGGKGGVSELLADRRGELDIICSTVCLSISGARTRPARAGSSMAQRSRQKWREHR
jgi:hypothetical protein